MTQYPSSISKELQPWPSRFNDPSDLYRVVVKNSQHPPLMQDRSWNLAVPYKEQRHFHTPSESIANNYTPTANQLKIKNLSQCVKSIKRDYSVLKPSNSTKFQNYILKRKKLISFLLVEDSNSSKKPKSEITILPK